MRAAYPGTSPIVFQRNLAGFKVQPDPGPLHSTYSLWRKCRRLLTIRSGRVMRTGCAAQVTIKKLNDDVQRVLRLRNIHIVKESVKKAFPHVEFGVDAQSSQLLVGI